MRDNDAPTSILVAPAFAAYACERSLACCKAPMLIPVDPDEPAAIRAALHRAGADQALADTLDAHLEPHRHFQILAHQDGACAMLGDTPSCRLHAAAGLDALPSGCRTFPRTVTARPDGAVEVAFTLRCTTAARLLAEAPLPFSLVDHPVERWPYDVFERPGPAFLLHGVARSLADIDALRRDWWAVLGGARSGADAALALAALLEAPDAPRAAPRARSAVADLGRGIGTAGIAEMHRAIASIPERGKRYARFAWNTDAALGTDWTEDRLTAAADKAPARFMAVASSWLQWAGVHDSRPFEAAVAMTVRRSLAALRLSEVFAQLLRLDEVGAWRDAAIVSAHVDVLWA